MSNKFPITICSMVLVYLPTIGWFLGHMLVNIPYMEHMGSPINTNFTGVHQEKKSNTAHTCEHREIVEGFRVSLHILSEEPRQRHLDRHGCHGPTGPAGRQASGVLFATVKQIERGFKWSSIMFYICSIYGLYMFYIYVLFCSNVNI